MAPRGQFIPGVASGALSAIAEQTLSAAAPSIDFQDLPQDYAGLRFTGRVRSSAAAAFADMIASINNDVTDANYRRQHLQGTAAAAAAAENLGAANIRRVMAIPAATAAAGGWCYFDIDVVDYAETDNYKTLRCRFDLHYLLTTGGMMIRHVNLARTASMEAMNRLTFTLASDVNFEAGSRIAAYGVRPGFG